MKPLACLALAACALATPFVIAQDKEIDRDKAVAVINKLKGKFMSDDAAPGKPIVSVNLHGREATDKDVAALKGLVFLRSLDLGHTKVTNAGLAHLKTMTQLEKLVLHDTDIGDAGLTHLSGLTKLQTLDLGDTQVTDKGVKALQKALPKVKIER